MDSEKQVDAKLEDAQEQSLSAGIREIDPVIAKRVVRKFDFKIMPWLFGLWFFAALVIHPTASAINPLKAMCKLKTSRQILG